MVDSDFINSRFNETGNIFTILIGTDTNYITGNENFHAGITVISFPSI
jgi:hypothetical protein